MRNPDSTLQRFLHGVGLMVASMCVAVPVGAQAVPEPEQPSAPIPVEQVGAVAGRHYQGEGLSVITTPDGARLRCDFQDLEGEVTGEGLWLGSPSDGSGVERFRVMAVALGRGAATPVRLGPTGSVIVEDSLVRFQRAEVSEEYSVSVDGVRQDFLVGNRPAGEGPLYLELELSGAGASDAIDGARLVVGGSGRALLYHRLRVEDAGGRELSARLDVRDATRLVVAVEDVGAEYPVRIDPTFSDADWFSMGEVPGANDVVRAAVADGVGNLYIGGDFTVAGRVFANRIAKWDGSAWSALGLGMDGPVHALAFAGTELVAGGNFSTAGGTSASHIAKWDGHAWSPMGAGTDGLVSALAAAGSEVYAGGGFVVAGGVPANRIAKWDGSVWSPLGLGMDGSVLALAISGQKLYAGGSFDEAGGMVVNNIAEWDGGEWSALGIGIPKDCIFCNATYVTALAVSGSDLYVAGEFVSAGGIAANHIAKWDKNGWSALDNGWDGVISALAVVDSDLYAVGPMSTGGGPSPPHIARWDGSAWTAVGPGIPNTTVHALAVIGTDVYAGGDFHAAGEAGANRIAKWNGSAWSALGSGMGSPVFAAAVMGADLYVGGGFTTAGGIAANHIARWDGNSWSALGTGLDRGVTALCVLGSDLYAGGGFSRAGGVSARCVAKWNGSGWSALGTGINGGVRALAGVGTELYAGGWFNEAGGRETHSVARWNGSAWSALGSGVGEGGFDQVNALALVGADLYAGGTFSMAGGLAADNIARWNGSAWSAVGGGVNGEVKALAVWGADLYVGGGFTAADRTVVNGITQWRQANHIAKWNGSAWSALGYGLNSHVETLAVGGRSVYAGGIFTGFFTAEGTGAANHLAEWDGSGWSALGSGTNGPVYALAVAGANLYAGGWFSVAGDKVSGSVGRARIGAAPGRFRDLAFSPTTGFSGTFLDASPGVTYRIQTSTSLAADAWTDIARIVYTGPVVITDASAVGTDKKLYRAVTP